MLISISCIVLLLFFEVNEIEVEETHEEYLEIKKKKMNTLFELRLQSTKSTA